MSYLHNTRTKTRIDVQAFEDVIGIDNYTYNPYLFDHVLSEIIQLKDSRKAYCTDFNVQAVELEKIWKEHPQLAPNFDLGLEEVLDELEADRERTYGY